MQTYTKEFYSARSNGSLSSAKEIVPYVIELIQPRSVVDVGCGTGTWLSAFKELGVNDIRGIDGDYVDRTLLQIPSECFLPRDLTQPLHLDQHFDLVVSLEVAEHLPGNKAKQFIDSLTQLGDVVLFSAAIPHQPGDEHINCQWIDYWAELFYEKGFVLLDCIRIKFWQNPKVDYWYAQNMFLMIRETCSESYRIPESMAYYKGSSPPLLVHPQLYLYQYALAKSTTDNISIKQAWSLLMSSIECRYRRLIKK